ncbi:MAG: PQQ-dependent sugar dehydrogenase, partial [Rhodothermia bacterium]|nr:PQQ-dependent sugar dehydrogenase [Rhodothermia bacterium]
MTRTIVAISALLVLLPLDSRGQDGPASDPAYDWRNDWELPAGYHLEIDASGFELPSAIAFVPNPGNDSKDPLYFVTELRGQVKVVTNDRSVVTFADELGNFLPRAELPDAAGQSGLAGICLEPERGYVFVTFLYRDKQEIPRNNIVRFQTKPRTFGLKPTGRADFTDVFMPHESGLAHHIGGCQIEDDHLYVGIGDGWLAQRSRQLAHFNGKLLRMTLDGKPVPSNPFYDGDAGNEGIDYVWAYGLRNPFGLKVVDGKVFVADNGVRVDRFLEVEAGGNYLWDGSDVSITSNADFVWATSIGPAQVEYVGEAEFFNPEFRNTFFVAGSGAMDQGTREKMPRIAAVPYSVKSNTVTATPRDFVVYAGEPYQLVVGVASGPDALYFVPILPDGEGRTSVLKVRRSLADEPGHRLLIGAN